MTIWEAARPRPSTGRCEPSVVADQARATLEAGFDALKLLAVPRSRALESAARVRAAEATMAAVRDAVGPDVDVMVDLHGRTSAAMAIRYGEALAPYQPWFFEEPVPPEDIDGHVAVARALPGIPIASR